MQIPFYDPTVSYKENYDKGPFGLFQTVPTNLLPKLVSSSFLGFQVDIPFGIPAGPLLNSKYVIAAWKCGYSLATYKTVRGNEYPCHPAPNVIKVRSQNTDVKPAQTVLGDLNMTDVDVTRDGITNSFGVPSKPVEHWQKDARKALAQETTGNLMILSFMGTKKEGMTFDQYVEDFARACKYAKVTGAKVLEVNFSCPNVGKEGLICNDVETSRTILEALETVKGNTPLLVKIGYFPKEQQTPCDEVLSQNDTLLYQRTFR